MDFLLRGYPNFCFLPKKLRQKQIKFCLKLAKFVQFGQNIGNIGTFHPIPDHKTMQTMCLGVFLAFLFILGQALLAHLVPCWWVGRWLWRAGRISQDTYIYFVYWESTRLKTTDIIIYRDFLALEPLVFKKKL